jgi:very-short-patch-repair endonuclease
MYYHHRYKKNSKNFINGFVIFFLFSVGILSLYIKNPRKFILIFFTIFTGMVIIYLIRHKKRRVVPQSQKTIIGQTQYARNLWAALKERGVDSITEYSDGHKKIDIAILPAKLYIEVDGIQHFKKFDQVVTDLMRDNYSDQDGFRTIRIPNDAIRENINVIADEVARQARERQKSYEGK